MTTLAFAEAYTSSLSSIAKSTLGVKYLTKEPASPAFKAFDTPIVTLSCAFVKRAQATKNNMLKILIALLLVSQMQILRQRCDSTLKLGNFTGESCIRLIHTQSTANSSMKIRLITIGKTSEKYLQSGMDIFLGRLKHYGRFEYMELPAIKNAGKLGPDQLKEDEEPKFMALLEPTDWVILLDEVGRQMSSPQFAAHMQQIFHQSVKSITFIIGGAYGFSPGMYARANEKMGLSKMTFSHQMVRLIALEQIYRAQTIQRGEKYHH
ncbi:MAG: 23S rRNA (pseudouridine1915-N3)-methyltransferase [Litorivivens sp.]|jgi:23S rRNA (pseudouridine1915-N3)-methyltransferase